MLEGSLIQKYKYMVSGAIPGELYMTHMLMKNILSCW